jgi:mRNA-degrading endonuclease RelE of RelBE toxin-antitoxin system
MSPRRKDVQLTKPAGKDLASIPTTYREAIEEALVKLGNDPLLGKLLKEPYKGRRSYRVGPYRITYCFDETTLSVISVRHRKDVYR